MQCLSRPTFVGWIWFILVSTLFAGAMGIPNNCPRHLDCNKICNTESKEDHKPQDCDDCCPDKDDEKSTSDRLEAVESTVGELKVMTGVLLALVLLLMLAVVVLFLHLTKRLPKMLKLPVSFRNKKDNNDGKKEKSSQKNCNGVTVNANGNRLANHESNSSPQSKRSSFPSLGNTDLEPQPRPFRRVRQPSESTCPEEGNDITPQGYDNLGLSTSTINTSDTILHNTSTASTDTLGPTLSNSTLHTTLASENHLISNTHHHNTRV